MFHSPSPVFWALHRCDFWMLFYGATRHVNGEWLAWRKWASWLRDKQWATEKDCEEEGFFLSGGQRSICPLTPAQTFWHSRHILGRWEGLAMCFSKCAIFVYVCVCVHYVTYFARFFSEISFFFHLRAFYDFNNELILYVYAVSGNRKYLHSRSTLTTGSVWWLFVAPSAHEFYF